ncbi:MAG TPA: TonB-dependent receptor [Vicinamibacterales bacterium]|nr:TonB-dependent receptor [Vicinamibacterales bacterium]
MKASLRTIASITIVLAMPVRTAAQVVASPAGVIRGVVLDRAGGSPIADVSVRIQDGPQAITTDAAGRFELRDVPPGTRTLLVSIVGFILVKRTLQVAAGETADVTVVLSEGTGTYSEHVMVTAGPFREQERAVPAQQVLGSADIQNLRSLVTNDPLRTVQVLPGVSTGDDFRSEFAVRGSAFSHIVFTFDGIPAPFLLHTVQQVQDGGSVAMVNGDILDGIALLNGSYPQRYGNRLGAEVEFLMREGSRERRQARAGVSGTDASFVAEGPLDARKSGSWLISVRKSYLEYLLKRVSEEGDDFGFGFSDVQAKVTKDVSSRHRLELSAVAGRSRLDVRPELVDEEEVTDGRNAAVLLNAGWRFTPSDRFGLTQRIAVAANWFSNVNVNNLLLGDGGGSDVTWRADAVATRSKGLTIEGGGQLQWQERHEALGDVEGSKFPISDGRTFHGSAYGQIVWSPTPRLTVTPGGRVDRWSLTSDTAGSPWVQVAWKLSRGLALRGGGGIHRQFAPISAVTGPFGNPDLRAERAYHVDIGVEQMFGATRWQVTIFNREERDVLRRDFDEFRLSDNPRFPVDTPGAGPWHNALDGYARGVELLLQRRSTSGVSGWFSYSYGVNRYTDARTGETFDGDFDQRHTVNAYGVFRLTNRVSLAAKWRGGSNIPATGYWRREGERYFLGAQRNALRVPAYSRLDVRGNRTFHLGSRRLTLFVEILNLLGRENVRVSSPSVNRRTTEVFELFQTMIPRVPSAGLLIEF